MEKNVQNVRWLAVAAVLVASFLVGTPEVAAQETKEEFDDTIHVIQKKPVLQAKRFELMPRFGVGINDTVHQSFKLGVSGNYHFSERAYVGGMFEWYNFQGVLGGTTNTFNNAYTTTRTAPDAPILNWFAGAEGGFLPLYGKFTLFNWAIIYWDLGATLGVGFANTESLVNADSRGTFAATGSLVTRLYMNDWLGLNLELRDVLFPGQVEGQQRQYNPISNIATVALGVSLYLPPSFEYSD